MRLRNARWSSAWKTIATLKSVLLLSSCSVRSPKPERFPLICAPSITFVDAPLILIRLERANGKFRIRLYCDIPRTRIRATRYCQDRTRW